MRNTILDVLAVAGVLLAAQAGAQPPVFTRVGTLQDPATIGSGSAFKEVELADLNEDGTPDFILPQKQPISGLGGLNRDILYLSKGDELILAVDALSEMFHLKPTSEAFPQTLATMRAYDVEIAHLDDDYALDMVRPDAAGNLVVWWGKIDAAGKPTGTFDQFRDVFDEPGFNPNQNCGPGNYDDVDLIDIDGDRDLDFVVADREMECSSPMFVPLPRNFIVENLTRDKRGNQPRVFAVRGADPSIPPEALDELPARRTHSVSFGDVDPPSAPDVVLADYGLTRIYFGGVNKDVFDFEEAPLVLADPGIPAREVVVADLVLLNDDPFLDLFVAQNSITGTTHGVYFHSRDNANPYPQAPDCGGVGEPPCSWSPAYPIDFSILNLPCEDPLIVCDDYGLYDARYGDLDDDGRMEIVAVNQNVDNLGGVEQTVVQVLSVTPGNTLHDRTTAFLEAPATLTGGMGVDLADLDNDGDLDMVLAGAIKPGNQLIAAATVYENRSDTVLGNRILETVRGVNCRVEPCRVLAIDELTAGSGVDVPLGVNVTFEAGLVRLTDGFTASFGSEFTARNF